MANLFNLFIQSLTFKKKTKLTCKLTADFARVCQPYLSGFRLEINVAIIGASFSFMELEVAIGES